MIAKVNPMYKHLTQKKIFCGPTCLQMILFRRGIWYNQERLAKEIDVGISKKIEDLYLLPFDVYPSKDDRTGLSFYRFKEDRINNFLRRFKLKATAFYVSEIKDIKKFVIENLRRGRDIIMNFWWEPFLGKDNGGHYVLIADYDTKTDDLTVCDPSSERKSFWKGKLKDFAEAMGKKWDKKERGFVVVGSL